MTPNGRREAAGIQLHRRFRMRASAVACLMMGAFRRQTARLRHARPVAKLRSPVQRADP